MRTVWGVFAGVAVLVSACSTTGDGDGLARPAFLPSLPPMPSIPVLPRVRFSDMRQSETGRSSAAIDPDLEPVIHWRVIDGEILVVQADSRGCTARSDFTVDVGSYGGDIYAVSLSREAPDTCGEALPWGVQIAFSLDRLGVPEGGEILVLNPLGGGTDAYAYDHPRLAMSR